MEVQIPEDFHSLLPSLPLVVAGLRRPWPLLPWSWPWCPLKTFPMNKKVSFSQWKWPWPLKDIIPGLNKELWTTYLMRNHHQFPLLHRETHHQSQQVIRPLGETQLRKLIHAHFTFLNFLIFIIYIYLFKQKQHK